MVLSEYLRSDELRERKSLWHVAENILQIPLDADVRHIATTDWRLTLDGTQHEFKRVWSDTSSMSVVYHKSNNTVYVRTQPILEVINER